jgi:ATP-dependent DNA helicase RecQ
LDPSDGAGPQDVLRRVFGFPAFRGLQEAAVSHVVAGNDALILMPTGGGKSLCYQLPSLCRHGVGLVISPLIALMDDQVAALRQLGVAAGALHSGLEPGEARANARALEDGRLDLIYVSPERLLGGAMLDRLGRQEVALIAIDEAHCVSQWGHEFRPEYRDLAGLGQRFPGVPRVALTATADPRTRLDILQSLGMSQARVFAASFHRNNLHIAASPKVGETAQLLEFLRPFRKSAGIVYCGTRNKTESTAQRLREKGIDAIAFHAGLAPEDKRAGLMRFRSGDPVVMVATVAFGMGIDRPDVRFVVHLDMPDSPEAYYQQIGRAGRDGDRADALLLYGGEDLARARHFLAMSSAPEAQKRVMRTRLESMIALTESPACRTRTLLACFGEKLDEPCGHCDRCQAPPSRFDGSVAAQKVLSAVYRTGQMFGAVHIVSLLRGETTEMMKRHRHDKLPTFGVGADQPAPFWRGVIRQLIAQGALDVDTAGHGGLFMVEEQARPILRGQKSVTLLGEAPRQVRSEGGRSEGDRARERKSLPPAPPSEAPQGLFETLKEWRTAAAKAQSVPAYVIFQDSVLREIAAVRPTTLDEFSQIKGVGALKVERYGKQVLELLARYGGAATPVAAPPGTPTLSPDPP